MANRTGSGGGNNHVAGYDIFGTDDLRLARRGRDSSSHRDACEQQQKGRVGSFHNTLCDAFGVQKPDYVRRVAESA